MTVGCITILMLKKLKLITLLNKTIMYVLKLLKAFKAFLRQINSFNLLNEPYSCFNISVIFIKAFRKNIMQLKIVPKRT